MATEAQPVIQKHIELRPNRDGQLRAYIARTRIRVQDIYVDVELRGKSPDEIISSLPHLTLAQVHAALSYYFDNRDTILEEMRQDEESVAKLKATLGPGPVEQKVKGTDADGDSLPS